jgi:peroxiredoxin
MGSVRRFPTILLLLLLAGCGGMADDLAPSGTDKRPPVAPGTTGPSVGQQAPDFTVQDSLGATVSLSATLATGRAVVLYFTMWCPVCDVHMSDMRSALIPANPDVRFLAVDYVSGSVDGARASESANGYVGSGFTVLADTKNQVLSAYAATMGTTVVIDNTGLIRMSEDYRDGAHLRSVLADLP